MLIGHHLIRQVGRQNLDSVHLLAHSAGAWGAYSAARYLRAGGLAKQVLQDFVSEHGIKVLNVEGPRESQAPGIHRWVMAVLEARGSDALPQPERRLGIGRSPPESFPRD